MARGSHSALAEVRRQAILESLRDLGSVRNVDLAERFDVTQTTIRNDLEALEHRRAVVRVHGGAVAAGGIRNENRFEVARSENHPAKQAIGELCAGYVVSGSTVLLDVGTTTNEIAVALAARDTVRDVTVVTNSLSIVRTLEEAAHVNVIITGGTVRREQHSLVNPLAGLILDRIHADLAFLGCNGVHSTAGITNSNLAEVEVKQSMIRAAAKVMVAADSSKLGAISFATVCSVAMPVEIITDDAADPETINKLEESGASFAFAELTTK